MNISEELLNNIIPNFSNIKTNVVDTMLDGNEVKVFGKRTIPLNATDLTSNLSERDKQECYASGMDTISKWFHDQHGAVYSIRPSIFEALESIDVKDYTLKDSFMMTNSIYFNFEQGECKSAMIQRLNRAEVLNFIDTFHFTPDFHIDMQVTRQEIQKECSDFFLYSIFKDGKVSRGFLPAYDTLSDAYNKYADLNSDDYITIMPWQNALGIVETCFRILAFTSVPYLKPTKLSNKDKKKIRSKISKDYLKPNTQSFRVCCLPLLRELREQHKNRSSKNKIELKNGRIGHVRVLQNDCFTNKQGQAIMVKPVLDQYGNLPKQVFRVESPPKGSKPLDKIMLGN